MKTINYNTTMRACFTGTVVLAIIVNFAPLLFLMIQSTYGISLEKITLLITLNFATQLLTDFASLWFVDKIGYRAAAVGAHILCATGLILMSILPDVCADPFIGFLIPVIIYSVGGGLLEVLMTPIVHSCPSENKTKALSLSHSFYCWGHVAVILVSTLFFYSIGIEHWKVLCIGWAIIPIWNTFAFLKVPIAKAEEEEESISGFFALFHSRIFWLFMLVMLCAGASEQAVAQWASTFAESALGVNKFVGDLAGPMTFAIAMGITRAFYGKYGEHIQIERFMKWSGVLCIISYLLLALIPNPIIGLASCTLTGFSVAIMWPGTCAMTAATLKNSSVSIFALLALAGDVGCSVGPTVVGFVSSHFNDDLRKGILAAIIFPIVLLIGVLYLSKRKV